MIHQESNPQMEQDVIKNMRRGYDRSLIKFSQSVSSASQFVDTQIDSIASSIKKLF